MLNGGSRECGHPGKSAVSGGNKNENIAFNVEWWQ